MTAEGQSPPTEEQLAAMPLDEQMAQYRRGFVSINDIRKANGLSSLEEICEAANRRREPYEVSDAKLLERVVRSCASPLKNKGVKHCRWVAVMDTFAVGSNYAHLICRRFGLDPDEVVKR